jgi:hypothetical protein
MGEQVPHFFISYSRRDVNKYLERFLADLVKDVADLLDIDINHAAFIDRNNISTGDDWNEKISRAAQFSKVLVCIYSPLFFSKNKFHEYCAKEFSAFLSRQKHSYAPYQRGNSNVVGVKGVKNIVPILWYSEKELNDSGDLPPAIIGTIQYDLVGVASEIADAYKTKGMRKITIKRTERYHEIKGALAGLIRDRSHDPLPPLTEAPQFAALRNAFWDPLEASALADENNDGSTAESAQNELFAAPLVETRPSDYRGPKEFVVIEVRSNSEKAYEWTSYDGEQDVSSLVEEIAVDRELLRRLEFVDAANPYFLSHMEKILVTASTKNSIAVVLLDPACLLKEPMRDGLKGLIAEGTWRGGFLIPSGSLDTEDKLNTEEYRRLLDVQPEHQQRIVIRRTSGSMAEFRSALLSVLDDILARIIKNGELQQEIPDNAGPEKIPRITNV